MSFSKVTRTLRDSNHLFFAIIVIIPFVRAIDIDLNFYLADFVTLSISLVQRMLCFNWFVHNIVVFQILVLNCIYCCLNLHSRLTGEEDVGLFLAVNVRRYNIRRFAFFYPMLFGELSFKFDLLNFHLRFGKQTCFSLAERGGIFNYCLFMIIISLSFVQDWNVIWAHYAVTIFAQPIYVWIMQTWNLVTLTMDVWNVELRFRLD